MSMKMKSPSQNVSQEENPNDSSTTESRDETTY